jgi:DNA-binding NarL/FixJ family response regulator
VRVVLADDWPLWREGVSRLLLEAGFDVVGQAGDASELLQVAGRAQPDVAVIDIRMPPGGDDDGLRAALELRARRPEMGILLLSQYSESWYLTQLLSLGGRGIGYVLKDRVLDAAEFTDAVTRVGSGGLALDPTVVQGLVKRQQDALLRLTDRERAVIALMAQGRSNQAISDHLFLGPRTVETYVHSIFLKLDLLPSPDDHRRVLAVLAYLRGRH